MKSQSILRTVEIENFGEIRGSLDVVELELEDSFEIKRFYVISNVPSGMIRGQHAHKNLKQIFFALSGEFKLSVTDGDASESVVVKARQFGYYLAAGYWRELSEFSPDAICLVLASEHYDASDYIYSYKEFLSWKNNG